LSVQLRELLIGNMGRPLDQELAARIYDLSTRVAELVPQALIEAIAPKERDGCVYARERMEDILGEMIPLHQLHWKETEEHRHGLELNPDYEKFIRHERAGRALVFTLRQDGRLLGNFSLYLARSMHTQTLMATEDTLFLLPEARKGRTAARFIGYAECCLKQLGAREINVSVKLVNKALRYFQIIGYQHVSNGLTKVLED
jgi:hypothetical protein